MEPSLQIIDVGRVRLRVALAGEGPLVVLVHGFPEGWYSWRHQIAALAKAGYRVAAPDVRGYGGSDKPHAIEAYAIKELAADIAVLIAALGADRAIVVGHDWGAPIAYGTALFHPERVRGVAGLSAPHTGRGSAPSIELYRKTYKDRFFYQLYFQEPGWPRPSWRPMCGEACVSSTTGSRAKGRKQIPRSKIRRDQGGSTATSTRIDCRPG